MTKRHDSLLQAISGAFSEDELRTLCFSLGVDWGNLPGETKIGKARELILDYYRRERLPELLRRLEAARGSRFEALAADAAFAAALAAELDQLHRLPPTAVPAGPAPRQLPPRAQHWTGRAGLLGSLSEALHPGQTVTLFGPGGIGKTALAAQAVGDLPDERFPDGTIFYTFYGRGENTLALAHIAASLALDAAGNLAGTVQRALAARRLLLVLDGAEEAEDLDAMLDLRGLCGVLITSRRRQDVRGIPFYVSRLQLAESVALLREWAHDPRLDEAAAGEICELVGNLPLAVRLAGRYLWTQQATPEELLEELEVAGLSALHFQDRRRESVPVLLTKSLDQVRDDAQAVLAVIGHLAPEPFTSRPIREALDRSGYSARRALGDLVNWGLLQRDNSKYEVSHALVHTFARQQPLPEGALRQLAAYFTAAANAYTRRDPPEYWRLRDDRLHIIATVEHCAAAGAWAAVRDLVQAVSTYLEVQGHTAALAVLLQHGIAAVCELGDRVTECVFLDSLGRAVHTLGRPAEAIEYYEQGLGIAREIGDLRAEGAHVRNLGSAYFDMGAPAEATAYLQRALRISRDTGDRHLEGSVLGHLGQVYAARARPAEAIDHFEQALAIAREIGDRREEGANLGHLGTAYARRGELAQAIAHFEQALAICRDIGDRQGEGTELRNLGDVYAQQARREEARAAWAAALAIFEEIGSPRAVDVRALLVGLGEGED